MGALTEVEIFDCMETNIKLAVQCCRSLAVAQMKGAIYEQLRTSLQLVEGCCRQASAWRSDTRWLNHGLLLGKAHKMAGDWLRGTEENGYKVSLTAAHNHKCFMMLANNLELLAMLLEQTKTKRTNVAGPILPEVLPAPTRTQGRSAHIVVPAALRKTKLILPPGVSSTVH